MTFRATVLTLVVITALPLLAADTAVLDRSFAHRLRAGGEQVVVENVVLPGLESAPPTIVFQRFEVWTPDAKIVLHGENGATKIVKPPATRYYKGTISSDPGALIFTSVEPDGTIYGMATIGSKRYSIASGKRIYGNHEVHGVDEEAPTLVRTTDAVDELIEGTKSWTCELDKSPINSIGAADAMAAVNSRAGILGSGLSPNVGYSFRISVETDFELYQGFGSNSPALTTYIGNLVGASSTIYQRDVKATLTVGLVSIWTSAADPWAVLPSSPQGAFDGLLEFGTYWHNNHPNASDPHAAAVMLSGKNFSGGVAWLNRLSSPSTSDLQCGAGSCGAGNDGKYQGAYAFCGSISVITTTLPDPNATVSGKLYGFPFNNNFWILSEFAHELGHVCSSPHTHCMTLSPAEKTQYNTTRNFVDECYNQEGGCFTSTVSNYLGACFNVSAGQGGGPSGYCAAPVEWGTLMSYCHNTSDNLAINPYNGGFRTTIPSRYTFGNASEPSNKVLSYFSTRFESVTPNVIITANSAPIACSAQNASVPSTGGVTYAWQITGGAINGSATSSTVNFTPSGSSVTLTVTAVNASIGATISNFVTLSTACGAISAPTNLVATAVSTTQINLTWTAVGGASSYQVDRRAAGGSFAQVGTPAGNSFNDTGRTPGAAYLYRVRAVPAAGSPSANSAVEVATTILFTDDPLVTGTTTIKAAHLTEIRNAVDAVRLLAGIGVGTYTNVPPNGITVKSLHITQLRTQLDAARTTLGLPALTYANTAAGSTLVRGADFTELRNGTK